jgi:hypothetical protein
MDSDVLDIAGTVTGESLLANVKVTVAHRLPPESTASPMRLDLALTGAGATRQFSFPGLSVLPLGPITITAKAENIGGLEGSASSTVTNLPAAIRAFQREGGQAALREFRFGLFADGRKIAVRERSDQRRRLGHACGSRSDSHQMAVAARCFQSSRFGCPLGEVRTGRPAGACRISGRTDLPPL